jgi:hypothetical protein
MYIYIYIYIYTLSLEAAAAAMAAYEILPPINGATTGTTTMVRG